MLLLVCAVLQDTASILSADARRIQIYAMTGPVAFLLCILMQSDSKQCTALII